jgi:hypothetical protein
VLKNFLNVNKVCLSLLSSIGAWAAGGACASQREILICPEKIFVSLQKLCDVRSGNFFYMSGKILMFSLPVRANYTVTPKQD